MVLHTWVCTWKFLTACEKKQQVPLKGRVRAVLETNAAYLGPKFHVDVGNRKTLDARGTTATGHYSSCQLRANYVYKGLQPPVNCFPLPTIKVTRPSCLINPNLSHPWSWLATVTRKTFLLGQMDVNGAMAFLTAVAQPELVRCSINVIAVTWGAWFLGFVACCCPCITYGKVKRRYDHLTSQGSPDPDQGGFCNSDCILHCIIAGLGFGWVMQVGGIYAWKEKLIMNVHLLFKSSSCFVETLGAVTTSKEERWVIVVLRSGVRLVSSPKNLAKSSLKKEPLENINCNSRLDWSYSYLSLVLPVCAHISPGIQWMQQYDFYLLLWCPNLLYIYASVWYICVIKFMLDINHIDNCGNRAVMFWRLSLGPEILWTTCMRHLRTKYVDTTRRNMDTNLWFGCWRRYSFSTRFSYLTSRICLVQRLLEISTWCKWPIFRVEFEVSRTGYGYFTKAKLCDEEGK